MVLGQGANAPQLRDTAKLCQPLCLLRAWENTKFLSSEGRRDQRRSLGPVTPTLLAMQLLSASVPMPLVWMSNSLAVKQTASALNAWE